MNRCNKAGIQIRGEDGVLDGCGNIAGHGVDPTGNVTDIESLVQAVSRVLLHSIDFPLIMFCEISQIFKVQHATPGDWAKHQFSEVTK